MSRRTIGSLVVVVVAATEWRLRWWRRRRRRWQSSGLGMTRFGVTESLLQSLEGPNNRISIITVVVVDNVVRLEGTTTAISILVVVE